MTSRRLELTIWSIALSLRALNRFCAAYLVCPAFLVLFSALKMRVSCMYVVDTISKPRHSPIIVPVLRSLCRIYSISLICCTLFNRMARSDDNKYAYSAPKRLMSSTTLCLIYVQATLAFMNITCRLPRPDSALVSMESICNCSTVSNFLFMHRIYQTDT
jgi:hypothetical protein